MKAGREAWTLMLCWPPYWSPMAEHALRLHRGDHVVYIGDGEGGCTATDAFHEQLAARYEQVGRIQLPQWPGLHDDLEIWERL